MVKEPKKSFQNEKNLSNTLLEYESTPKKTRQQINQENYQKNKEKVKNQQKERYQQQKNQTQQQTKEQLSKYYGAEAIKILMSLKQYTELNQEKMKLWVDFNWTMKDCRESIKEGYADIVAIMKLEQVANNLIRDYWETAKAEKTKGKSWNTLTGEQQTKLIKYWGYEKARIENGYLTTAEQLEKQSQEYLKDIELAKFHEERGKIKCECYQCEAQKEVHEEVKAQIDKELKELEKYVKVIERKKFSHSNETFTCDKCGTKFQNEMAYAYSSRLGKKSKTYCGECINN